MLSIVQCCPVGYIIDVFVNVFNYFNRYTNLHIDVHIVNLNQIRAVENHSSIIYNDFIFIYFLNSGMFIIAALIQRVTVFYNNSFRVEGF